MKNDTKIKIYAGLWTASVIAIGAAAVYAGYTMLKDK